jgi:hypothetical protein
MYNDTKRIFFTNEHYGGEYCVYGGTRVLYKKLRQNLDLN